MFHMWTKQLVEICKVILGVYIYRYTPRRYAPRNSDKDFLCLYAYLCAIKTMPVLTVNVLRTFHSTRVVIGEKLDTAKPGNTETKISTLTGKTQI